MTEKKIIVLDDEPAMVNSLRRALRAYPKYEVVGFTSAERALQELDKGACHAFITDVRMPKISGAEVIERIKEKHPEQRCIVMTGYAEKDSITRIVKAGNTVKILLKPLDFGVLIETLDSMGDSNLQAKETNKDEDENKVDKQKDKKEYSDLPVIECQASQLNQVFMNFLVNAAHAIEDRGVITIRTGTKDEWVWVEIEDNGSGITEENQKKLFEPFFTTKPVGQGTGLGLSLSYGIIQAHKGHIDVDSTVGKGTKFRIWLPIQRVQEKESVG